MQAGETRMGFPGGQSRASPLEAVHRARLSQLGAGVAEIPNTATAAAPDANAGATYATATTITSTCHQLLPSRYDITNINDSQQLIYSATDQQQVVVVPADNFHSHATPQHHSACRASHQHHSHHPHHPHLSHDTSTSESYLHLHQATTNQHHQHSNLVRKHQNHKHQSHHGHQHGKHTSSSSSGATKAKQQIAAYALQRAAAASASQQSLLAPRTTSGGGGACSPAMLSAPETCLATSEGGVVSPARSTIPTPQYAPQARARVGSISEPRRQVTPTSYSPTPQTAAAAAHVRSLSFSAASASEALLAARGQLAPTTNGAGELCCSSDTGATYLAQAATVYGDYQTPSLLSSSACSSIGSPARPASLLDTQQQSPSPAPPVVHSAGVSSGSILYDTNNNSNRQYHHATAYQHAPQVNHHSYGGGNSSAPSGGSSTISTSDSLNMSINLEQYISKRNERERSRVRNVNDAFDHLKNSLPLEVEKMAKRMSKVEILRTAIGYIRDLENMLGGDSADLQPNQRAPSGGNRSGRQRSFGASSERDHQIAATAKALRRELGSGHTGGQVNRAHYAQCVYYTN